MGFREHLLVVVKWFGPCSQSRQAARAAASIRLIFSAQHELDDGHLSPCVSRDVPRSCLQQANALEVGKIPSV
jgi:hypothetical protein